MFFDGPGFGAWGFLGALGHLIATVLGALVSLAAFAILIAIVFLLVRFLLVGTKAAQLYVAQHSPAASDEAPSAPVAPAAPTAPAPPATVTPAAAPSAAATPAAAKPATAKPAAAKPATAKATTTTPAAKPAAKPRTPPAPPAE